MKNTRPDFEVRALHVKPIISLFFALFVVLILSTQSSPALAEHCWLYVDGDFTGYESTPTPLICVEEGDLSCSSGPGLAAVNPNCGADGTPCCCSWDSTCEDDGDASDCCTSVPPVVPVTQNVLDMHSAWHACFGNTGSFDPPPGRSARWLGFHRQFEFDFDLFREDLYACSPLDDLGDGCFIEALDWHAGMTYPYGHFGTGLAPGVHARNCGQGPLRPDNIICESCNALPECLYNTGAGPLVGLALPGCPGFPGFASSRLEDIPSLDDVGMILDSSHHGRFHGEVGWPHIDGCGPNGDCTPGPGYAGHPGAICAFDGTSNQCRYNADVLNPLCSPRDPMFWRLHKRLDDTVRAWQEKRPVDVTVVIDRSGSMGDLDSSGATKMSAATEAMTMFADLLEDGTSNRIGVVSFSGNASAGALNMGLTDADVAVAPVGTLATTLETSTGGCTSMGSGLQGAVDQLCNGTSPTTTETSCHPLHGHTLVPGERKAMILLTDGLENRSPCINSTQPTDTPGCGTVCGGAQLEMAGLGPHTELCAVGFGEEGSLNGNLLTLLAERQGGLYMQSPALGPDDNDNPMSRWVDLKDFFVKCLGQISDEFIGIDPKGVLEDYELATEPTFYNSCGDERLTMVGGWNNPPPAGVPGPALILLVNTPNGDLVRPSSPFVESSAKPTYEFRRVPLPFQGEAGGEWRAQLVRPHQSYVNAFTTDSLDTEVSVPMVRRQIQRLCPDGCSRALYYEDGFRGPASSYEKAVDTERGTGLLSFVTQAGSPDEFADELTSGGPWDLIVYAHQLGNVVEESYDPFLIDAVCSGLSKAIITDTRTNSDYRDRLHECAAAPAQNIFNWRDLVGDGKLLEGAHTLTNHGYSVMSYQLATDPDFSYEAQSFVDPTQNVAIGAKWPANSIRPFERWSVNVLVRGLGRLGDAPMRATVTTGEGGLLPSVRILPANMPLGGYDSVDATVEVQYPTEGLGQTISQQHCTPEDNASSSRDTPVGRLAALVAAGPIGTATAVYPLNDDGKDGDLHPQNGQWSTQIPILGQVDGMYRFHFKLDLTKNGCTTRREMVRSSYVEVGVDFGASNLRIDTLPDGYNVSLTPRDSAGNLMSWGRTITCGPEPDCSCSPEDIVDNCEGDYSIRIKTAPGVTDCTLNGLGRKVHLKLGCELDWNQDGIVDAEDYIKNSLPYGGYYFEWYVHQYYQSYYPILFPEANSPRLDWDGDGHIDDHDLVGEVSADEETEGFYTAWLLYTIYPQYFDIFLPHSSCEIP